MSKIVLEVLDVIGFSFSYEHMTTSTTTRSKIVLYQKRSNIRAFNSSDHFDRFGLG